MIIPISLFLLFLLIIKHENIHDYKSLIFIPFINPAVIDEFRDIQSEIPGLLFFFLGIYTKHSIFKNFFFIVSILFRPTFVPLVLLFFILQKKY